jgi:hypothetical protein
MKRANETSCIFAPPEPNSVIGNTEEIEVAWCVRESYLPLVRNRKQDKGKEKD